jgi:hypothetical protein
MTDTHANPFARSLTSQASPPDAGAIAREGDVGPDLRATFDKWGDSLNAGFQLLPDVLLRNQRRLNLSATDLVVLINVLMQWWFRDRHPFPKTTTIAGRMGASPRTVQRSLNRLEKLGLLQRVRSSSLGDRRALDPSGLVERLTILAYKDPSYRDRSRGRNGGSGVQTQI